MSVLITSLLLALPWLAVPAFLVFVVRLPRRLPPRPERDGGRLVSVIVPARNERVNIGECVRSLTASTYPSFEVIVVDDRSDDDTARLARAEPKGNARELVVVDGEALPDGWLGKPWACWQGARRARGDLLLFTDADTRHGPALLSRAVAGLEEDRADLLTVIGRQIMGTFWERLVQPQIFMTMIFRFPRIERMIAGGRWWDAIANGQFMLFRRDSYEALGGHEAVCDEVVEDLAFAQRVVREGRKLSLRMAEDDLATRMYRSLGGLVEGWSKNMVVGGLQGVPPSVRPVMAPLSLIVGVGLWIVPPMALALTLAPWGLGGPRLTAWAATATGVSVGHWALLTRRMGAPAWYGFLYPLGAAVGVYIFLRSWLGGRNVVWKGRRYRLRPLHDRP